MMKTVLRLTLTTLALVLMLASSVNLRSANASVCVETCGCNPVGGPDTCCTSGGTTCYTRTSGPIIIIIIED